MTEELISFETAKLAKEKGFDEICYYLYDLEEESIGAFENGKFHKNSKINLPIRSEDIVTAPTQSLLQKWLREEHRIHITIRHYTNCPTSRFDDMDYDDELGSYGIEIHEPNTQDECDIYVNSNFLGETYEEVLEIALQEALKII